MPPWLGRRNGVEIIAKGGSLEGLTKEEAIIVRYGRELMDDHNTIVLGALMGYYSFISCILLGTDMRPPVAHDYRLFFGKTLYK